VLAVSIWTDGALLVLTCAFATQLYLLLKRSVNIVGCIAGAYPAASCVTPEARRRQRRREEAARGGCCVNGAGDWLRQKLRQKKPRLLA
jgi:hypothetical protein